MADQESNGFAFLSAEKNKTEDAGVKESNVSTHGKGKGKNNRILEGTNANWFSVFLGESQDKDLEEKIQSKQKCEQTEEQANAYEKVKKIIEVLEANKQISDTTLESFQSRYHRNGDDAQIKVTEEDGDLLSLLDRLRNPDDREGDAASNAASRTGWGGTSASALQTQRMSRRSRDATLPLDGQEHNKVDILNAPTHNLSELNRHERHQIKLEKQRRAHSNNPDRAKENILGNDLRGNASVPSAGMQVRGERGVDESSHQNTEYSYEPSHRSLSTRRKFDLDIFHEPPSTYGQSQFHTPNYNDSRSLASSPDKENNVNKINSDKATHEILAELMDSLGPHPSDPSSGPKNWLDQSHDQSLRNNYQYDDVPPGLEWFKCNTPHGKKGNNEYEKVGNKGKGYDGKNNYEKGDNSIGQWLNVGIQDKNGWYDTSYNDWSSGGLSGKGYKNDRWSSKEEKSYDEWGDNRNSGGKGYNNWSYKGGKNNNWNGKENSKGNENDGWYKNEEWNYDNNMYNNDKSYNKDRQMKDNKSYNKDNSMKGYNKSYSEDNQMKGNKSYNKDNSMKGSKNEKGYKNEKGNNGRYNKQYNRKGSKKNDYYDTVITLEQQLWLENVMNQINHEPTFDSGWVNQLSQALNWTPTTKNAKSNIEFHTSVGKPQPQRLSLDNIIQDTSKGNNEKGFSSRPSSAEKYRKDDHLHYQNDNYNSIDWQETEKWHPSQDDATWNKLSELLKSFSPNDDSWIYNKELLSHIARNRNQEYNEKNDDHTWNHDILEKDWNDENWDESWNWDIWENKSHNRGKGESHSIPPTTKGWIGSDNNISHNHEWNKNSESYTGYDTNKWYESELKSDDYDLMWKILQNKENEGYHKGGKSHAMYEKGGWGARDSSKVRPSIDVDIDGIQSKWGAGIKMNNDHAHLNYDKGGTDPSKGLSAVKWLGDF